MATFRERPYMQFNFLVNLGDGVTEGPQAGFQEISGIGTELTVSEYRTGNYRFNNVMKFTSLNKAQDVTLKRGVIGTLDLYNWLDDIRSGRNAGLRNLTVQLQSEDRENVALTWSLDSARITKYTAAGLNAKGTDVAVEELVVTYERLRME